jgi:NAD-dependent SIR2 family protein deacetylase
MDKVYLYKTQNSSVAYDDEQCYVNDQIQEKKDGDNVQEKAKEYAFKLMAEDLSRYLSHFRNIAVLAAAGTSMENGTHGGKTRTKLWESYEDEINKIASIFTSTDGPLKDKCTQILQDKNIEDFLSFTILYEKLNGEILDKDDGKNLRIKLENKIATACKLDLDETNQHHQDFIRKLTARKPSEPRLQLYTTNYDTLFEQAARRMNYVIIDGFSLSYPRVFNGTNFDFDIVFREHTRVKQEESFVPNVFQLFKLHGSIDWEKNTKGQILQKEKSDNPCIIYPASEKYESSYDQPYFEMMSHFQQTLRKENTLLIVVGFGFKDKHIQNVIKEASLQNHNLHVLIVCYGQIEKEGKWVDSGITSGLVPDFIDKDLNVRPNISVLFSKFKAFVEHLPMNDSYNNNNPFENASI